MQTADPAGIKAPTLPGQAYIVVSDKGDFVTAPEGPGRYEDSSCADALCAPVVFDNLSQAETVALAMCVDSNGFFSSWKTKLLPAGCATDGLAMLLLDEFTTEAARLHDVFGLDVRAYVSL